PGAAARSLGRDPLPPPHRPLLGDGVNRTVASGRVRGFCDGADGNRVASKGLTAPRPAVGATRSLRTGLRFGTFGGAMAVGWGAVNPFGERKVVFTRNPRLPR